MTAKLAQSVMQMVCHLVMAAQHMLFIAKLSNRGRDLTSNYHPCNCFC